MILTFTVLCIITIVIGAIMLKLILRDYEHKAKKCRNCKNHDNPLEFCWAKVLRKKKGEKACHMFMNKHYI